MISMTLEQLAEALGLERVPGHARFSGVAIDSRCIEPGNLFAALPGERVDGHDFVGKAAQAGAVAALVQRLVDSEIPQLVVGDVRASLGRLAAFWREQCSARVIGITGSNGKTTTREMVSRILARKSDILSTSGNYNNELGLPLTLFRLTPGHRYAVLEMGAAASGDIAYLSTIARQEVGLVTNVGPAHLQGFGDEEGVARAKGEIYEALPQHGVAVINLDDPFHPMWLKMAGSRRVVTFGHARACDVRAEGGDRSRAVVTPGGRFELKLPLPGEHNFQNALAATAVAIALDIPIDEIQAGLASARPVAGRLNLLHSDEGWTIIDDTYNANPASLYAALQVLAHEPGEPWLVLGDMRELGHASRKLHAEMGEAARSLGVQRLFAIGDSTHASVDAFGNGGRYFQSRDELIDTLSAEIHPGVTCLVKGSRSMGMETVVAALGGVRQMREAG